MNFARVATEMKCKAINKIATAENFVFMGDEKYRYADNETVLCQLRKVSLLPHKRKYLMIILE